VNRTLLVLICGIGLASCDKKSDVSQSPSSSNTAAPATPDATPGPATQPDNTGINSRDRVPDAVTAGSQGQGKSDIEIAAQIRQQMMKANLSISAQNIKVISQNGKVTLRGPVTDQNESDKIGQIAANVAGAGNVDNQLEIKPNG
jgi:hypothetical protein